MGACSVTLLLSSATSNSDVAPGVGVGRRRRNTVTDSLFERPLPAERDLDRCWLRPAPLAEDMVLKVRCQGFPGERSCTRSWPHGE